ncbi:hypothetical protein Hanom_Chr16g01496011 [Helianthus anomalus]
MKNKPYKASRAQFTGWSVEALLEEIARIVMLKLNLAIKPTLPNWAAGRKLVGLKAGELTRMNEELAAAKYGSMQSIAKWDESTIRTTYKNLEALRAIDLLVPRKPNYEDLPISSKAITYELPSARQASSLVISHLKKQKDMSAEDVKRFEEDSMKEGIKNMIMHEHPNTNLTDLLG